MRARRNASCIAVYAGAGLVTALMFGFVLFATSAGRKAPAEIPQADGIVVLTGADNRIPEGMRLLAEQKGRRLLISGVNPRTSREEVRRYNRAADGLFACCVDIGYLAQDTIGNADEAMEWARRHKYRRLIVVTSSYHMPRSLAEISRVLPEAELIASPVVPRSLTDQAWWLSASATRMLLSEYLKLLPSAARLAVARLARSFDAGALAAYAGAGPGPGPSPASRPAARTP